MKFKREEDKVALQNVVQTENVVEDKKEQIESNRTVKDGETVYLDMDKLRPNSNNNILKNTTRQFYQIT